MYAGWYRVAFSPDATDEIFPVEIGSMPLVLVRTPEGVGAFDAVCPHRGAHLGYGGRLDGGVIVCPFHGRRIGLGEDSGRPYCVRQYRTLDVGGSVFVLLDEEHENGLTSFLERLAPSHYFASGFVLEARVAPEFVIENVFDTDHFTAVHGLARRPQLEVHNGSAGELTVEAIFETPGARQWQGAGSDGVAKTRFCAHVFSPTLVASELGDAGSAHVVFTSATPTAGGDCVIRVSLAMAPNADGSAPPDEAVIGLLRDSRRAFEQDLVVWEHLVPGAPANYDGSDRPVIAFRTFCERFVA
jgi:phenylpropionate dioxygenase-like ring-hydroxylating dioxygenase large terminal subunit